MKTILSTTLLSLTFSLSALAADRYVAPDGNDTNPGSRDKPFKTLTKARDALRASNGPDRVILRGGIYRLSDTFELGKQDSDTTFIAAPGEAVRIIGGHAITTSAVKAVTDDAVLKRIISAAARSKVKQINLKALGITNYGELGPRGFRRYYIPAPMELFIDGKAQTVARWPNKGEKHIPMGKVTVKGSAPRGKDYSFKPGAFEYDHERPNQWTAANDVYVSGIFAAGFADDTIRVAKVDTAQGTFTLAHPHIYGLKNRGFCSWYALNLLEEIDLPGEFYIDKASGTLYFYPPETFSAESEIHVSSLDTVMVAIENAENVRFENLILEITRDSGVYIEGGKSNVIAGCTLRNIGNLAVQMGQGTKPFPYGKHNGCGFKADGEPGEPASRIMGNWHEHIYRFSAWNRNAGTGHQVLSCDIYDIGAGGIMLGGGDRKTLTPGKNMVKNCDIYRVNRWDRTYKAPVNVDGCGNIIVNNHIHDCPGIGVYLNGNDHVIEYNEIDHLVSDMSDMGAIYMGRDPSATGNSISYNFFHHIKNYHKGGHGVQAIFFDDCSFAGARVVGNVFYKSGSTNPIKFNGGGNCEIRNNIFVDCRPPVGGGGDNTGRCRGFMKGGLGHERVRVHVDITKPPYSTRYPELLAVYEGTKSVVTKPESNYIVNNDHSQFVDAANLNFKLKPESPVFERIKGFKPIPFDRISLQRDEYRKTLR